MSNEALIKRLGQLPTASVSDALDAYGLPGSLPGIGRITGDTIAGTAFTVRYEPVGDGGGTDGAFLSRPILSLFGWEMQLNRRQRPMATYYVALGLMVAMYLGLVVLLRSLFGRVLEGIRVNEHRMQALGFNTYRYKLAAFVLSATFAGVAGATKAIVFQLASLTDVDWTMSGEVVLMTLVGGVGTVFGPVVGGLSDRRRRAGTIGG